MFSNAKKLKTPEREAEYENIRKDYFKVLDDAGIILDIFIAFEICYLLFNFKLAYIDEKVQQANQMYDLVDRYLRRLDQELHKFKMELEADNRGITELLEKRNIKFID